MADSAGSWLNVGGLSITKVLSGDIDTFAGKVESTQELNPFRRKHGLCVGSTEVECYEDLFVGKNTNVRRLAASRRSYLDGDSIINIHQTTPLLSDGCELGVVEGNNRE
jgi:hypothetical protein